MSITIIGLVVLAAFIGLSIGLLLKRKDTTPNHLDTILADINRQQAEMTGRLNSFADMQEAAKGEINRTLSERLDSVSKNVTHTLQESREKTSKTLGELGERLSLIDKAQQQITALSGQVVELQHILDNKQARGAFGEAQLADIVIDGLPESAYLFQHTLSNGKRADCLINLPNPPGPVVVDSKFPLEAYQKFKQAADEIEQKTALQQFGQDTLKHAEAIRDKYIITGETADAALMFLPSESIFSELHIRRPDIVDKCRSMRVYPVSPNTMSLTLNTVRAIMRDVKMREQASIIQKEVHVMIEDVVRLNDRISKLRTHFDQANKDIEMIETSGTKISRRGEKITALEVEDSNKTSNKLSDKPDDLLSSQADLP
ncbi:hypothetical protein IMCC14465_06850 [alpha proteobacterium IMCC14465]|uniref:DNA recombination protein RmuC homolog n=1 Tax=alpha proteobacterium IMCC14465 TaxID=1220535 RepID=J9DYY2_9PROT|nr:hypothetical protein IMCC14465_06850 [alpha proteobacterium IMCC14465]